MNRLKEIASAGSELVATTDVEITLPYLFMCQISVCVQIAFAEELLQRHLLGAAKELVSLCQGGGVDAIRSSEKETVRVLIVRIQHCLSGVRSGLPDFKHAGADLEGVDLSVTAAVSWTRFEI
jgi:hypothetical protein